MTSVRVRAGKPYDVFIGSGISSAIPKKIKEFSKGNRALVVSDDRVFPLHGEKLCLELIKSGIDTKTFVFKNSETSKNINTLSDILEFAAVNLFSRDCIFIALGGGVTGDITGLAASLYMRGVPYIQVPTTLLAMTDSSVGGKTAVDLKAGKNLMGAFYQPACVLCDTSYLDTLPEEIFCDGMAEVIKYGMIYDKNLFDSLYDKNFDREKVIERCVSLKASCVALDEFDRGERKKLNFGHTVGHALELLSNYKITHGQAVSAGMCRITKAAAKKGLCDENCFDRLFELLSLYGLKTDCPYPTDELMKGIKRDKKRENNLVSLVIPREIGKTEITEMDDEKIKEFLDC